MKLLKNKIFLAVILCLTVLSGAFYFVNPTNKVSADDDYTLEIKKVDMKVTQNGETYVLDGKQERTDNNYKPQDLLIDNVAMLLNSKPIVVDIDGDENTINDRTYYRQYIKVAFSANLEENTTLQFLEVNATLNGIAIDTKEVTSENDASEQDHSYEQYFDLTDIKLLRDQTPVDITEAQGLFKFTFGYMAKTADGITSAKNTVEASFYALNEASYINKNTTSSIIEPRVANTENISRAQVAKQFTDNEEKYANIYSFFNYNNLNTFDYFDNSALTNTGINYPTITYDPTKYYVSYSKILYGETETATTVYDPANNQVVLTKTANGNDTTTIYNVTSDDNGYYVEIPLYDIGNYHISFDFVVKQYNTTIYEQLNTKNLTAEGKIDKTSVRTVVSENWARMGDVELSIYGYQLYHTVYKNVNGAGESELTNHATLFADVTNANIDGNAIAGVMINGDINTIDYSYSDNLTTFNNIVATNQAPLSFKYNGNIVASGVTTQSYYNLYTDSSKANYAVVNGVEQSGIQIDSNTRFTENGYYEVFIAYFYNGYKYFGTNSSNTDTVLNGNNLSKVQTFAFVIENIDPELTLKTVDSQGNKSEFDANGYTNQDVVMTWDVSNSFNVLPEIYISTQAFNSSLSTDVTSTYQSQIDKGKVTLTDSYHYTITIKYGPCTYNNQTGGFDYSASVDYMFTIDKETINDIAITKVTIGSTNTGDNFILDGAIDATSTNQNFVVTFGEQTNEFLRNGKKASGATITATYTQLLFSENSNLKSYIENNDKVYVLNGYEIKSSNNDLNYTQITKAAQADEKAIIDQEQISSVLTENGIYIFNFVDQAGNTANYVIILDKTAPTLLKNSGADNYTVLEGENNIVSTDTDVLWGNYKAISFNSDFMRDVLDEDNTKGNEIFDILTSSKASLTNIDGNYYYYVDIDEVTVEVDKLKTDVIDTGDTFYANNPDKYFNGEAIYIISVKDNLGNTNGSTYLEMNFDKSLLMAHIDGSAINNIQTIGKQTTYSNEQIENQNTVTQRLFPNAATNRQKIYVDWLENAGTEYEIGSVICEFYPLTFEDGSANYPYSSTSTQTFDLTANKTYGTINNEQRVVSAFINLVQDDRYGTSATMPGMYKVVRKYAATTLPESSLDMVERTYFFYVDRQNIISYFNNNILIGANIQINMQNGSKTFAGAQFLQEFVNDYVLETNKLPVKTIVPAQKYNNNVISVASNTITPIALNYIVKNELGEIVYDSTDNTLNNKYIKDGIYTVTIYDSTNAKYDTSNLDGTNKIVFQFKINNIAPQVSIINKDNIIVNDDAFNNNKVKLGWKEDTEGYMANIDQKYLTVKKLLPSGAEQVIYKLTNGVIETGSIYGNVIAKADENASWQYEIDLSKFAISDDCKLEITVQYEGNEDDYGSNFKTTQTIYFDYTAPEYNYNKLLGNDQYLTNEQKSNFGNTSSDVNFENYAFMIDETFKIDYAPADSFWKNSNGHNVNDTISAWYRKYDKYADDNDALTMQSIIPTDSRYSDLSQAPQRLRFNENLLDGNGQNYYTVIGDRDIPFYQVVNNQPGYYEIIEEDIAGNYRIYTVVIYPSASFENALSLGYYNVKNDVNNQVDWQTENANTYYYNINSENIEITNINLYLQSTTVGNNWFNVYLTSTKDGATTTATYATAPIAIDGLLTIEQLITEINNFIYYDNTLINSGYSFGIVFSCSNGKSFTINYKTPGGEPAVEFVGSQTNLTVTFVQDPNASVYLTEFYVYEAQNGVPNYNEYLTLDSNNTQIVTNPTVPNAGEAAETISYTFRNTSGTGRNLVFVYKDNFDVEYRTFKIIGITDVDYDNMIVIDGAYDKITNTDESGNYYEYFTNQIVKLNYQTAIYTINYIDAVDENTKEPIFVDINELNSIVLTNGTTLLSLYTQRLANTHIKYEIGLTDTLGNSYKFVVNYYSKLADLSFMDSGNRLHDMEAEDVTTRALYLTFDKNQFAYETFVTITKSYTDDYGEYFEETFDAQTGLILNEGANYIITKYNKFGDSYTYSFTIRKSAATHFYSVLVKPDGINYQEISPSSVKYNYNNSNIEQYFTIYEAIVEVSSTDNLVCEVVQQVDHGNGSYTYVYYIHTDDLANITYEKYIAVTKINYTRNILGNNFIINENQIVNQKLTTVTTEKVTITMPAYNEAPGNQVQVQVYYNSEYIGYLQDYVLSADGSKMSFELNDSGTYMLYVSDLAGNNQWFNDKNHFTLYVLNNVVYKLNDNYGIANSVFNTNVTLSFDETQTLFTRQEVSGSSYKTFIAITSTLNGKPYTPTRSGEKYIYSDYGTYTIRLSGIINNDTENPIITEVKFSIINENEAKVAHEYIGLNGYEVTNIVKNGTDITDQIREKLNMLTINSFALSGGTNSVGGNGHYQITVRVNHNSIIPTQYFTYNVWINNDTDALILCSLAEGESTTGDIEIQLNLYQIYSKIGECVIKVNGNQYITINATTASVNQVSTYVFTANQRYNVTLETNSGNTLLSFVVTKVEPLNTIAIIVIVVASLVVVGLTVTFILLRKKMKIR